MDVLEALRNSAPKDQPSEQSIQAARTRLAHEIAAAQQTHAQGSVRGSNQNARQNQASNPTRHRLRWAGGLTAAAVAVTAGIVVGGNIVPGDSPNPTTPPPVTPTVATGTEILQQAAMRSADIDLAPGQYLKIEEVQSFVEYSIEDAATGELVPAGNRENAEAAFITERTTSLYVPADREDEWVWDLRGEWSTPQQWGERADEAIETWRAMDMGNTPELWQLPGGRDPENEENPDATIDNRAEYEQMPREPEALLDWYREQSTAPQENTDAWIVWTISSALATNLAPADLRAAMFDSLALIDGVEVIDTDGALSTFTISQTTGDWTRTTTFTVDTDRALVTSVADTSIPQSGSIVPANVPDEQRIVSVEVVDDAPEQGEGALT